MCGRYMLKVKVNELVERFKVVPDELDEHGPTVRYNVAPSQHMPVIVNRDGQNRLSYMQWGLVPRWAMDLKAVRPMINARVEGILTKPTFRGPVRKRRCLIPSGGFYEWQKAGTQKVPHLIQRRDQAVFAFAGIYDEWHGPEGEVLDSFAILTTRPNTLMASIHDRMPVILPFSREDEWLQTEEAKIEQLIEELCEPCAAEELHAYPISTLVNSPRNDSPEILVGHGDAVHLAVE
jgi:putative SOS response-associated peptidase YedK